MITKENLKDAFASQMDSQPLTSVDKYKDLSCYGNCPDFTVGDRLLFFVLVTADYDEKSIKDSKDSGNLLTMHDKIKKTRTRDSVEKITESYLSDPQCELLNYNLTKISEIANYPSRLRIPVFVTLNRLDR